MRQQTANSASPASDIPAFLKKVTPQHEYIMRRFSRMVGEVLDLVEASSIVPPAESPQYKALKKLLNNTMYNFRNDMLKFWEENKPREEQ